MRLPRHPLAHQQWALPSRRRPDPLRQLTKGSPRGRRDDWLVIEMKATRYCPEAADQILGYVKEIYELLAGPDEDVVAIAVTDAATYPEQHDMATRGIEHVPLSRLGYREYLARLTGTRNPHAAPLLHPIGDPAASV